MQSQEERHNISEQSALNTDPREQPQLPPQREYVERPYAEGYTETSTEDWFARDSGKLRPTRAPQGLNMAGALLLLLLLLCALTIGGTISGILVGWLSWSFISGFVFIGALLVIANWRTETMPMPVETFQVTEHAHLRVNNAMGKVSVRRGERGVVTVAATKRTSGVGVDFERMQVETQQHGDAISLATHIGWSLLQLRIRTINLEITVPEDCDLQLENGAGRLDIHGVKGDLKAKTGSGRIEVGDLQGFIRLKTGSGRIEAWSLKGAVEMKTGSGSISVREPQGKMTLTTGSGRIEVERAVLSGSSLVKTGSGSITFDGAIDPLGDYQLLTGSGSVNVTLPTDASFTLDTSFGSRPVNEFMAREVGVAPRARLKIRTGSGSVRINKKFSF